LFSARWLIDQRAATDVYRGRGHGAGLVGGHEGGHITNILQRCCPHPLAGKGPGNGSADGAAVDDGVLTLVNGLALGSFSVYVPSKIDLCFGNFVALKGQDFGVSALGAIRVL